MATLVSQKTSDLEEASDDIAAAGNLNQLKVALQKLIKSNRQQDRKILRIRARFQRLRSKIKGLS